MLKRLFDICFAVTLLCVFLPLLTMLVILAFLFEGRPVFFKQQRVGFCGNDFTLWKFRSMSVNKDSELGGFDAGSNMRVTAWGSFIRKTKFDELPQLWNVLKGDMSFIGPRPEVRKWVAVYPERWSKIHQVRPGISDPASIKFRNEEELLSQSENPEAFYKNDILPQKLTLYESYVEEQSFFGDIKLIIQTIFAVLRG